MPPLRSPVALLLLSATLSVGCARTLHYPRRAEGPPIGEGTRSAEAPKEPVAAAPKPPPPKATKSPKASKSPPKTTGSSETWATSDAKPPSSLYSHPGARGAPEVAELAASLVGAYSLKVKGQPFRMDCSGFVRAVYHGYDVDLFSVPGPAGASGTEYIYRYAQEQGRLHRGPSASPGDVVFFHDTYDRNHNGRRDDSFTHVAIVESIDRDGTITLVHATKGRVRRAKMNLSRPHDHTDPDTGMILNDYLRQAEGGQPSKLMGELFFAFGQVPLGGAAG